MLWFRDDTEEELESDTVGDDELELGDDALEELDEEDEVDEDEGFGHLPETDGAATTTPDEEEDEEDETPLEEDAEDVDYDTFDDIDEM